MNSEDAKNLTKFMIETLREEELSDNQFFEESKFKARFYKTLLNSQINKTDINSIVNLSVQIANSIIDENLKETVKKLIDKGLLFEYDNEYYWDGNMSDNLNKLNS